MNKPLTKTRIARPILAVVACLAAALVMSVAPAPASAFDLASRVVEHRLDNGMLFLLVRRTQAPVFSGYIRFRVGGADEPAGASGVAHLFEHMAFKGTTRIGIKDLEGERPVLAEMDTVGDELAGLLVKGDKQTPEEARRAEALTKRMLELRDKHKPLLVKDELSRLYLRNGAVGLNATTSKDLTSYFVNLPANRLKLWALLEADRLAHPVLREFWSEKDVVMEERRMRVESNPGGKLYEAFVQAAYPVGDPYHAPTVGTWADLRALTAAKAREFHAAHYTPENAVGALVGDFELEVAKDLLSRTFGVIPARKAAPPPPPAKPRQSKAERRVQVPFDAQPAVMIGFHKPNAPHRDDYVADVLHDLLTHGRTARLNKALVQEQGVVTRVGSYGAPGHRRPNLLVFRLSPRHPHTTADAESALYAELDRLKTEPVGEAELNKVRTRVEASFLRGLDTNSGLASQLTYFQSTVGDWRYVATHPDVLATITAADIQTFAKTYLNADNRVVATLVPAAKPPAAAEVPTAAKGAEAAKAVTP